MVEVSEAIRTAVSEVNLQESVIPVSVVAEALSTLGRCKSDGSNVSSNHLLGHIKLITCFSSSLSPKIE